MATAYGVMVFLVALSASRNYAYGGIFGPSLESDPLNQTAMTGDTATLTCDLEDGNERTVLWYSYQTQSYITQNGEVRNPVLRDRFSVDVNYTTQRYVLRINYVKESDAGTYECAYLVDPRGGEVISLAMVHLTVLQAPASWPECALTYLPKMVDREGDSGEVDVSCTWKSNHTGVKARLFQGDTKLAPDVYLSDRIISRVDIGDTGLSMTFGCEVAVPDLAWSRSCTIDTESNPSIKLGINPLISKAKSNSMVSMNCYGQSSDTILEYAWRIPANESYQTRETYNREQNYTSLEISGLGTSRKTVVVQCEVSTEDGKKASTVAVVDVRPRHHPLKSSTVIISLLVGLMLLILISVIIICVVCSSKRSSKNSLSRQRLLAVKRKNPPTAYDTVAKYYQDGHLSMNLDSPPSSPTGGTDNKPLESHDAPVSHKRSGSIRAKLYTKPIKLPKKLSRSGKSMKSSHNPVARSSSKAALAAAVSSESNVLYENLPRTGSISSLYSRFSTESGTSATGINETSTAPGDRAAKENLYQADPVLKHSYIGMTKTKNALDAFANDDSDDVSHDYMSIDDEESGTKKPNKTIKYVELDLQPKSPKEKAKKKPKVKWSDSGVVYTELNI